MCTLAASFTPLRLTIIGDSITKQGAPQYHAVLDPSYALLIAIAGARLVTAPWQRPRWIAVVPIAGAGVAILALLAGVATALA